MGEVYRARDTRLDRTVAIKILPTHLSDNPEFKQRFEREARAISSFNHPHICHLYDIGSHGGTDFLIMEFLDGETLADRLRRGAMPLPELLKIGMQIAAALETAHGAGIVHRDLKPGNIMLTKSGAKLMDFGLAKPTLAASGGASAPLLSAARWTWWSSEPTTFSYHYALSRACVTWITTCQPELAHAGVRKFGGRLWKRNTTITPARNSISMIAASLRLNRVCPAS